MQVVRFLSNYLSTSSTEFVEDRAGRTESKDKTLILSGIWTKRI